MRQKSDTTRIREYVTAQKFYFLAEQCLSLVRKSLGPLLRERGITHSQHLVLLVLRYSEAAEESVKPTDLSFLLGLERHTLTSLVDSLERKKLVKRAPSTGDRRVIHLKLTPAGRRLAAEIQPLSMDRIATFPSCTEQELSMVFTFLERLREILATSSGEDPLQFRSAFQRLLVEGEDILSRTYDEEENGDRGE